MPNMTHPAATTEDDWNKMKDAEEWDTMTLALDRLERERDGLLEYAAKLKIELEGTRMNLRNAMSAGDAHLAELAKAAIEVHDLREEKEYAIRMCGMWRTDSEKLEALTIQLVKAQQQNNQRDWVAVIDALRKYGEAAMEWNEGDAPKVGAGDTATEGHNVEFSGRRRRSAAMMGSASLPPCHENRLLRRLTWKRNCWSC